MKRESVYFFSPDPNGDDLIKIGNYVSNLGYSLSFSDKNIMAIIEAQKLIQEVGVTKILSMQYLTEEVLPDNTPRDKIIDTLCYKLDRIGAKTNLIIIDPYVFPTSYDQNYEQDLLSVFENTLKNITSLDILTLSNRNITLEKSIIQQINLIKPNIVITTKYSNVFHDRFWIADESRGLFVGTSLNGIGRRYALIDYIDERDTLEIVGRYKSIT